MPDIRGTLKAPRLASAPSTPTVGQMYYNTTSNELQWWNGTAWIPAKDVPGGALPADTVIAAATRIIANKLVGGDTQPIWRLFGDGKQEWGVGGTTAPDVNLYRYAAGYLASNGGIFATKLGVQYGLANQILIEADSHIYFGSASDVNLYRGGANQLRTDDSFFSAVDIAANLNLANQIWLSTDGRLYFGSASDTNLYRSAVDTLRTDDNLSVGGVINPTGGLYDPSGRWFINPNGTYEWGPGDWNRDVNLYRYAAGQLATDSQLYFRSTTPYIVMWRPGEAAARFYIGPDGAFNWGPGTATQDVNLYRLSADKLVTNDAFIAASGQSGQISIGSSPTGNAEIYFGNGYDTVLYRFGVEQLATNASLTVGGSIAVPQIIQIAYGRPPASAALVVSNNLNFTRFEMNNDGKMFWGPGVSSGVYDTNLYRSAAGVLKTDGQFEVGAAGIKFSNGSVQTVAAGAAGAGTKVLLNEQILAATATSITFNAIPSGYRTIEIRMEAVITGADAQDTLYTFDVIPAAGASQWMISSSGFGIGVTQGFATTLPLGRARRHSAFGADSFHWFCQIELMPGYDTVSRHGLFYRTISRQDQAGTNNDPGMMNGGAMVRAQGTQVAITGFTLTADRAMGIGTRVVTYGVL